ncbi:hypothetical protein L7F22_001745 [Adiantum nelumboides]|nr:hypothetical protein [Adiantum nelumboides]
MKLLPANTPVRMEACLGLEAFVAAARVSNKDFISIASHCSRMSALTIRQPISFSCDFTSSFMPNSRKWMISHALSAPLVADEADPSPSSMLEFVELAHQLADAAGEILLKYFRKRIEITDKEDLSNISLLASYISAFTCRSSFSCVIHWN